MRVQMKVSIVGTRDGAEWPPRGGEIDLPDAEGAHMCAAGLAVPVVSEPAVERAVAPAAEKRTARKRAAK